MELAASQDGSFPHSQELQGPGATQPGKVMATPPRRPLERWTQLQLPNGPMAQDFERVRRSRASMTVGQTSIS
jgi:hypothetical protein